MGNRAFVHSTIGRKCALYLVLALCPHEKDIYMSGRGIEKDCISTSDYYGVILMVGGVVCWEDRSEGLR